VNLGTIWGRFVEKTEGQKSRATVPLMQLLHKNDTSEVDAYLLVAFIVAT
jgi:hypothetical protein